jgi:RNA polymerase sigma-70 factor (ECF subfamily)
MEEQQLILKAKGGDRTAIELLYRSTITYIYKYVRSCISDKDLTDDVVSTIYLNAFSKIVNFRGDSSFKTWLHMIARNEIYQQYKRNGIARKHINIDDNFLESNEYVVNSQDMDENYELMRMKHETELENEVEVVFQDMKPRYAEVLRLRYLSNLTVKECSEILQISENNVKVLQNRAIKAASKLLKKENGKNN